MGPAKSAGIRFDSHDAVKTIRIAVATVISGQTLTVHLNGFPAATMQLVRPGERVTVELQNIPPSVPAGSHTIEMIADKQNVDGVSIVLYQLDASIGAPAP